MKYVLWIVQILLAALFLFAGVAKFVLPLEQMQMPIPLPIWFLRFIAVCEILGALGLVLPGLFGVKVTLTPLAAAGLFIIMIGATITSFAGGMTGAAFFSLVVGLLAAFVFYGRRVSQQAHRA
jgi:hypothetical protein